MAVGKGVAVGGSGVFVGSGVGSWPNWVEVGRAKGGGEVCVGNMTDPSVTVGLNTAVMVRSGVGNTIGVGDETKGKLQASMATARAVKAIIGFRLIRIIIASQKFSDLQHHYKWCFGV